MLTPDFVYAIIIMVFNITGERRLLRKPIQIDFTTVSLTKDDADVNAVYILMGDIAVCCAGVWNLDIISN